nr:hypothetical protein [uncultured Caldimonas sp.]
MSFKSKGSNQNNAPAQTAHLTPTDISRVDPVRRSLMLAAGSSVLLAACGGGQEDGTSESEQAFDVTSGGPRKILASEWGARRDLLAAQAIAELNQKNPIVPADATPGKLIEAIKEALKTTPPRPVRLHNGITWIGSQLNLALPEISNRAPVVVFSDGDHHFAGPAAIDVSKRAFHFYGCVFTQNGDQLKAYENKGLELWYNKFHGAGGRAVRLIAVTSSGAYNQAVICWNEFRGLGYSLEAHALESSRIENNYSKSSDEHRNFQIYSAWHSRFTDNLIVSGVTGINFLFKAARSPLDGEAYPSRQSFFDVTVDNNTILSTTGEAIGFDVHGDDARLLPIMDQLMLARDQANHYGKVGDPQQPQLLVKLPSGRTNSEGEKLYQHYFVYWLTSNSIAGKYAQIWRCGSHGDGFLTFALRSPRQSSNRILKRAELEDRPAELAQEDFDSIQNNQHVAIGAIAANIKIRDNYIECSSFGDHMWTTAVSMWGGCTGFEISGNKLVPTSGLQDMHRAHAGIRLTHMSGLPIRSSDHVHSGKELPFSSATHWNSPVAFGKVQDNDLGGLGLRLFNRAYSGAGGIVRHDYPAFLRGNVNMYGGAIDHRPWVDQSGAVIYGGSVENTPGQMQTFKITTA